MGRGIKLNIINDVQKHLQPIINFEIDKIPFMWLKGKELFCLFGQLIVFIILGICSLGYKSHGNNHEKKIWNIFSIKAYWNIF
jgi:hypothetical protein